MLHHNSSNIYNNLLNLEKNMLHNNLLELITNINVKNILNENTNNNNKIKTNTNRKIQQQIEDLNKNHNLINKDNDWITIDEDDKKFWYFYMFINNLELLDLPDKTNRFKIQTETKIKFIEELNKLDKNQLKIYKLSKNKIQLSISDFKNKLVLDDLVALCIMYKRNLIYAANDMYYEINAGITSGNNVWDIIIKDDNIEKIPNESKKNELLHIIKSKYYKVDLLSKIMKSISSYTLLELQDIAKKINISTQTEDGKNKLKKNLYDDIYNKMNYFK